MMNVYMIVTNNKYRLPLYWGDSIAEPCTASASTASTRWCRFRRTTGMGKQHLSRDERLIMKGKLQGTRENMDMVAMVLMDKCGWHVFEETADSRDTHSIAYLYECLEKLAEEINEGRIKRKHIRDVLKDECGVVFGD